jgi:hypothetical protein
VTAVHARVIGCQHSNFIALIVDLYETDAKSVAQDLGRVVAWFVGTPSSGARLRAPTFKLIKRPLEQHAMGPARRRQPGELGYYQVS